MNRRQAISSLLLAAPAALALGAHGLHNAGKRTLHPPEISRDLKGEEVFGVKRWTFSHRPDSRYAPRLEIGQEVFFDGQPLGAPTVDGVVTEYEESREWGQSYWRTTVEGV